MRPSGVFQEGPGPLSKLERAQACIWAAGSELMRLLLLRGVSIPSVYQLPANGYKTIHRRLGESYKHMESFIWLSFELAKKIKLCNLPKTCVGYGVTLLDACFRVWCWAGVCVLGTSWYRQEALSDEAPAGFCTPKWLWCGKSAAQKSNNFLLCTGRTEKEMQEVIMGELSCWNNLWTKYSALNPSCFRLVNLLGFLL